MTFQDSTNPFRRRGLCSKITALCTTYILFLSCTRPAQGLRQYQYYNTVENYPVPPNKFRSTKQHTQGEVDKAWIRVPWSSGGYYYHNTLTREDKDSTSFSL